MHPELKEYWQVELVSFCELDSSLCIIHSTMKHPAQLDQACSSKIALPAIAC